MPRAALAHPGHPVVAEMRARQADLAGGRPLEARGTRLALVVQGGAMRGVYSGAALIGLERLGLAPVFDVVYGESAGAINAAYFLAGQAEFGARIYRRDACSSAFINPLRPWRLMDVDYMIDHVMTRLTPLDTTAVLAARASLVVSLTRAEDGAAVLCDTRRSHHPLLEVLRATATATPLHPHPTWLDGVAHVDGGIANPVPLRTALDEGCTHVLALMTVPADRVVRPLGPVRSAILGGFLRSWSPALRHAFLRERWWRYNAALDVAYGRADLPAGTEVAAIPPPAGGPRISRITRDGRRLGLAADAATAQAEALLGGDSARVSPPPA
jgi:predicted patatin/cPLA2 family phospholipase